MSDPREPGRRPTPDAPPPRGGRGEAGYNLIILMVLVTVMNIMVAVAVPSWSKWAQREKEEELIFRGLQYAEAIRVFQTRFGRPPTNLEELLEVEPRSIRQLFPNPMTENGKWGILIQAPPSAGDPTRRDPAAGQRRQRGGEQPASPTAGRQGDSGAEQPQTGGGPGLLGRRTLVPIPPTDEEEGFGRPGQRTTGPIVGVYAGVEGESIKVFLGQTDYSAWHFTTDLLPMPVMLGGDAPAPRVTAAWVGRPFREDLQPQSGAGPGGTPGQGRSLTDSANPSNPADPARLRDRGRRRR